MVRIDNIRSSSAFNPRRRPALAPAAVARFEQAANRVKLSAASTAALALRTRDRCSDSGMRRTAPCRAGRPAGVKAPAAPRWGSLPVLAGASGPGPHRQKGFALEPGAQSGFGHYQAQEIRTLAWLKSTFISYN